MCINFLTKELIISVHIGGVADTKKSGIEVKAERLSHQRKNS